jgi:hypothetical protein
MSTSKLKLLYISDPWYKVAYIYTSVMILIGTVSLDYICLKIIWLNSPRMGHEALSVNHVKLSL